MSDSDIHIILMWSRKKVLFSEKSDKINTQTRTGVKIL